MTTGSAVLRAGAPEAPVFRGPLEGQRPRGGGAFGGEVWLVLAVVGLVGLGVVMVFNVSYFHAQDRFGDALLFFRKHLLSIGLGAVAAAIASRVPSDAYRRAAYPLLLVSIVALALVLVPGIGAARGGARRWVSLGLMSLQPSELAKFAVVLYLAASLARKGERLATFTYGVVPHALAVGVVAGLVLLEPDFGTATLIVALLGWMLFVGGVPLRHFVLPAVSVVPAIGLLVWLEPYRWKRLIAFWYPDLDPLGINFQLKQSFIAFGSGGLWGMGLGESRQKMFYLPEAHTDFIFSVIGEELGLAGALVVLALFAVVGVRGFRVAVRHPGRFASLLAFGVTLSLVLQGLVNALVVLGCLPTKGLALPFVSYGGSAMIVGLAQVGVLLALARETQ
jgi:cell division protein FtsW